MFLEGLPLFAPFQLDRILVCFFDSFEIIITHYLCPISFVCPMCNSSTTSENANAAADSGDRRQSLQFIRQACSAIVSAETDVGQIDETNESTSTFYDFYEELNDIASEPSDDNSTKTSRAENCHKRRRVNKEECHSFAFAELFFDDLSDGKVDAKECHSLAFAERFLTDFFDDEDDDEDEE